MNNALRITAFAAALAATFGTAYGVGRSVGPLVAAEDRPAQQHGGHGGGEEGGAKPAADHAPGGLQVSEGGYTLDLATPTVRAGARTEIRFAVKDDSGRKVTAYQREHGKELHFILASTDLTQYRHLHPVRAADGTWSTPVDLPEAGGYRVFADFTPAAAGAGNLTLGADLAVSGAYRPAALPAPGTTAEVDGYRVALGGELRASTEAANSSCPSAGTAVPSPTSSPTSVRTGIWSPCARATWPICTSTRTRAVRGRRCPSPRRHPVPERTGSSSTSSTRARCAPRRSPSGWRNRGTTTAGTGRAGPGRPPDTRTEAGRRTRSGMAPKGVVPRGVEAGPGAARSLGIVKGPDYESSERGVR